MYIQCVEHKHKKPISFTFRDGVFCIDLYLGRWHSDISLKAGELPAERQARGEEVLQRPSGADIYFGSDS